jgi:outer membrane protein assembly factor BamB
MRTLLTFLAFALAPAVLAADAWPGFRGTGDSVAKGDYPTEWSPKTIAWKVDLPGYGQSCPVVWNGVVYLTSVEGDQREKGYVVALDAKTGNEKWRHTFEPTQKAKWAFTISRGAPTPCVDAAGVYCFFEGGNVLAFDHAGKIRWERNLVKDYGEFQGGHGVGSSPAQTADAIFILIDHRGPSYLVALDKATGKNKWKTDREQRGGWSSPVIATRAGKPEVIASSAGTIIGYAADSGKELWKLDDIIGNTLPSASVVGDRVLFGGGTSRSKADPAPGAKGNGCLKLVLKDGQPGFESAWNAKVGISNYATPLGYEGVAYFVNQVGVVYAHDLASGKELFAERIDGACWASPLGAGQHVYFFGKDGTTTVLKAGKEFDKVASNKLWEAKRPAAPAEGKKEPSGEYLDPIVYGVAAADGAFFVRTGTQLFRVGK